MVDALFVDLVALWQPVTNLLGDATSAATSDPALVLFLLSASDKQPEKKVRNFFSLFLKLHGKPFGNCRMVAIFLPTLLNDILLSNFSLQSSKITSIFGRIISMFGSRTLESDVKGGLSNGIGKHNLEHDSSLGRHSNILITILFSFIHNSWSSDNPFVDCVAHLPDELLLEIFSHVPWEDVTRNVSRVCKHWHALAADDKLFKGALLADAIWSLLCD